MIMAGLEFTGEIPFKDVYFTPIIRDEKGRKLSKSLGNSPDPIDVMDTYGADALRFTMVYLVPVGQDIRYSNEKCETGRNFATKLWNAARFLKLQDADKYILPEKLDSTSLLVSNPSWTKSLTPEEKYIIIKLQKVIEATTESLEKFRFNEASHILYDFVWHQFCDWYIEYVKYVNKHEPKHVIENVLVVANYVLASILKLLHPIMPYLTEEIWHTMGFGKENDFLVLQQWPRALSLPQLSELCLNEQITQFVEAKHEIIRTGRLLKAELKMPASYKPAYVIKPHSEEFARFLTGEVNSMITFLNASSLTIQSDLPSDTKAPCMVTTMTTVFMPLDETVDIRTISERLTAELEEATNEISRIKTKLSDEQFLKKAPSEIVERHKSRLMELQERTELVKEMLQRISH
jgi:valyl-tRNA synthetase